VRSLGIKTNFKTRNVEGRYQRVNNDDNAKFKARFVDPENGDWQTVVVETTWSGGELGSGPNFKNGDVNGYIEVQCLNGTITAMNDPSEDGKDFFLVKHRMFGERIIPFSFAGSEEGSFQAEVLNFALSVKAGKEPILSAQVGANVLKVLNAAQLSEYLGGVNVTPQQLEKFENDIFEQEKDIWKAADIITDKLTFVTEYDK
jgi:predicted dehydrogenase